jgi:hypothetical protein
MSLGALAPAAVAASWPALRRLGGHMRIRDADIEILRAVLMIGVLPAVTIEQLAAGLEHAEFAPRQVVFEQVTPATGSTWSSPIVRRWSATDASSTRSGVARGSARLPCWATNLARPPSAHPGTNPARVGVLQRPAFLTAVTRYPVSTTAGQEVVALVATRDAERLAATTDCGGPLAGTAERVSELRP